jgi:non-lysosomal glucosylceramidase
MIDQVIAQWHANLCGLGEIFDKQQVRKALQALYRNNFKPSMRNEANTWRLYSLNDEGGLIICSWPEGSIKPAVPLTYSPETMTGFEYQAASHMIQEGLIEEGISIVMAIRNRYDGEKRNPWNEIECGSNYARSMASYSLLNAFSGFEFNAVEGMIGFKPVLTADGTFQTFWSLDSGWGLFKSDAHNVELQVLKGTLNISTLRLPEEWLARIRSAQLADSEVSFQLTPTHIHFPEAIVLDENHPLSLKLSPIL